MKTPKNLNSFISLLLSLCLVLSAFTTVMASPVYQTGYETDFTGAQLVDITAKGGSIKDGSGTEMFTNADLASDASGNTYIKGHSDNANAFFFKARVFPYNTRAVMDFDVNLGAEEFAVLVAGSRENHAILGFKSTVGLVDGKTDGTANQLIKPSDISTGWHNVKIMLDYAEPRKYSVIFDGSLLIDKKTLDTAPGSKGIKITTTSGVDNFKYYLTDLPQPYDAEFESQPKVGTVAKGKTQLHSFNSANSVTFNTEYTYFVSDTETGTYTKITSGDAADDLYLTSDGRLAISGDVEGKWLKTAVRVYNNDASTYTCEGKAAKIAPCDLYNLTGGTISANSRFKIQSDVITNAVWQISPQSDISLTADGIIEVSSNPAADVYITATNPENGDFYRQKLNFISPSDDKDIALTSSVYPLVFDTVVSTAKINSISAGSLGFTVESDNINGVPVASTFAFKLVYEGGKYYAFADGKLISNGNISEPLPLQLSANDDFESYYAGSPLVSSGSFIKADLPAMIAEGTNAGTDYMYYNESGVYPDTYIVDWYLDSVKVASGDSYFVPYGKIGEKVYYTVTAGGAVVSSGEGTIGSQYELDIISDGIYELGLKTSDRDVYAMFVGDNNSVYYADMSSSDIVATLMPGQGYTLYFINKTNLSLRGMPVAISGNSYNDIILPYSPVYINYLVKSDITGQVNSAAMFEKAYLASGIKDKMSASDSGDLSNIICDVYVSDSKQTVYSFGSNLPQGSYNLVCADPHSTASDNAFYHKEYELFKSSQNFSYSNFENVAHEVLSSLPELKDKFSLSDCEKMCLSLNTLTDKNKPCILIASDAYLFPSAVAFASVTEHTDKDETSLDLLKAELDKVGLKSDFVALLKKADSYTLIMSGINPSDGLKKISDNLKSKIIFSEVKNALHYKNVKQFLEHIGSTVYNGASEDMQNKAAEAVYKKTYTNMSVLIDDVEKAINPPGSIGGNGGGNGGGGGGGGSMPPVIQSGTITEDMNPPEPVLPITPAVPQSPFNDVDSSHWAYDYIIDMNNKGIMSGYNGKCRPEDSITRAEYVKIICVAYGIETDNTIAFDDIKAEDWYASYIGGAHKYGIVMGNGSSFIPGGSITREDAAVMLWRLLQKEGYKKTNAANIFKDSDFSSYSQESISELCSLGIINGITADTFAPKKHITRAQAAKLLHFAMNIGGDK